MPVLSRRALRLCATSVILLLAALAAGCTAPAGHPALEQADTAVERARRSPRVRALAAAELDRAEVALQDARAAARAGASPDRVEHLVYVVNQRAALAEARAAQRVARSEIAMLEGTLDHTLAQGRVQPSRHRQASFPAGDRQPRAPLQDDARTPWAEDQQAPSRLPVSRQDEAPLRELQQAQSPPQAHTPLQEPQQEQAQLPVPRQTRAPLQELQQAQSPSQAPALLQEPQQDQAPPQVPRQTGAPLQEFQQAPPPRESHALSQASHQEQAPRQAHALLEESQQELAPPQSSRQAQELLQESRHAAAPPQEAQEVDGPIQEAREGLGSMEQVGEEQPHPVPAAVEDSPREITLNLAQLSFAGAEPTSETGERLAGLAEQLLREPEHSVSIQAEFNLPDPEARTTLEQRVEIVRAILLRRGIAPARVVVRASGDGPAEPRATSPLIEAPY
jgi:Domain of unknown function (DUF4398)